MAEYFIVNRLSRMILGATILILSASCSYLSPYRMDINQGNYLTNNMIARLQPGMTKDQVRYALGTSLLIDTFHPERWNYIYMFHKGGTSSKEDIFYRVVLFFDDAGRLERVEGTENLPSPVPSIALRFDPPVEKEKKETKADKDKAERTESAPAPDGSTGVTTSSESEAQPAVAPATPVEAEESRTLPRFGSESQLPALPGMGNPTQQIDVLPTEEEVKAESAEMQGF